jgi:hypothetical protein
VYARPGQLKGQGEQKGPSSRFPIALTSLHVPLVAARRLSPPTVYRPRVLIRRNPCFSKLRFRARGGEEREGTGTTSGLGGDTFWSFERTERDAGSGM